MKIKEKMKMENKDFLLDYKPVDVSKEVGLVWSIANSLRGAYYLAP